MADAGVDQYTFHVEPVEDVPLVCRKVKEAGMKVHNLNLINNLFITIIILNIKLNYVNPGWSCIEARNTSGCCDKLCGHG